MLEEQSLYEQGYEMVCGMDEVGRGPLAGPVVTAAVVLPRGLSGKWVSLVRDSKQLSPSQREYVYEYLLDESICVGVGSSEAEEIDRVGIAKATRLAMVKALGMMPIQPQYLLLDAFPLPEVSLPQKAIIHGDVLCRSIAAASIVAKVTRDRMMVEMDAAYPMYGFGRHKGYGTKEHLDNLKLYGPCAIHRRSFAPVREMVSSG